MEGIKDVNERNKQNNNNKFLTSDSAVSEALGFVTILGILLLSLSIIGVVGYPMLVHVQTNMNEENTKQSFIVLAGGINKIPQGHKLSSDIELKIYDGTVRITDNSSINITAVNSSGSRVTLVADKKMHSIESTTGNMVVAYEGTGIWYSYGTGAVLNAYKPLVVDNGDTIIIPTVEIRGYSYISGSGTVNVEVTGTTDVYTYNNVSNITVAIKSKYLDGWADYFKTMSWDCDSDKCTLNRTNINVHILNTRLDTKMR